MDREKVIKGLEHCINHDGRDCPSCPYCHGDCVDDLCADALALLKQEPVKPIRAEAEDMPDVTWYVCPVCRIAIDYHDRFCRHCGRELVW